MPYMRAVLKEALRISPVLAGNARQTGRDIVLNGYRVPEGVSESDFMWIFRFVFANIYVESSNIPSFSLFPQLEKKNQKRIDGSRNGNGCSTK